ncbi:MAG: LysR family transcriptional regulator [Candidatus Aegiribacteria sp.]
METQVFDTDVLIIESNSVLNIISPDLHIHIVSPGEGKPSARGLEEKADLVPEGPLSAEQAKKVAGLVPVLLGVGDMSSISIGGKHWLNIQGKPLFGEGRMDLLKAVRDTGSILQAAGATGIQYKRAWVLLRDAEERLGAKLLFSGRGGSGGGGTRLTPLAGRLLDIWERSEKDFNEMLKRLEAR